jgi:serine/threonine protein kinase
MSERPRTTGPSGPAPASPDQETDTLLEQLRTALLGSYEVFGEIGRGGMATVYLGHELALERKVAIKVMSPALVHGQGMVERFKREARTAAHLSHPNIIPVYAVREGEGLLFFVMKLVEGTPLDAIMKEVGKLPLPMVEAILAQVGGAFGYAHRHGIVHRDIKPSNILIDDEGWAVVTDFGIAKVQESEGLTQSGVAVGTPTYMSPEQCSGGTITGASDQYSLGIVAYEMLTGRPPFTGTSMMPLMYSHFHDSVPPIEQFRPDCPLPIRDAVYRMLQKDPAARFPTMEDAVVALGGRHLAHDDPTRSQLISLARTGVSHKIISQVQTPRSPVPLGSRAGMTPSPTASTPTPAAPSRRGWLVGAGLVAIGALATVAVMRWTRPSTDDEPLAATSFLTDSAISSKAPDAPVGSAGSGNPAPPLPKPVPPDRSSASVGAVPKETPGGRGEGKAVRAGTPQTAVTVRDSTPVSAPVQPAGPVPAAAGPAPVPPPPVPASRPVTEPVAESSAPVDEKAGIAAAILAYGRSLDQADLAQARTLYPGMTADQRQDLEAFWKAGGTMQTRWTVSAVVVDGNDATARVTGTNTVTIAKERPSQQRVNLRARLERRGTEWRLVALVN